MMAYHVHTYVPPTHLLLALHSVAFAVSNVPSRRRAVANSDSDRDRSRKLVQPETRSTTLVRSIDHIEQLTSRDTDVPSQLP